MPCLARRSVATQARQLSTAQPIAHLRRIRSAYSMTYVLSWVAIYTVYSRIWREEREEARLKAQKESNPERLGSLAKESMGVRSQDLKRSGRSSRHGQRIWGTSLRLTIPSCPRWEASAIGLCTCARVPLVHSQLARWQSSAVRRPVPRALVQARHLIRLCHCCASRRGDHTIIVPHARS
jgi:hypothetical protein